MNHSKLSDNTITLILFPLRKTGVKNNIVSTWSHKAAVSLKSGKIINDYPIIIIMYSCAENHKYIFL